MSEKRSIHLTAPFQLHLIAWPYILFGVAEVVHHVATVFLGTASSTWVLEAVWIVLIAFAGFGLLRFRFTAWVVARVAAVIIIGFSLIFAIYTLVSLPMLQFMSAMPRTIRSNSSVGYPGLLLGLLLSVVSAAWGYWQYCVLNSATVKRMFLKAARRQVKRSRWQWNLTTLLLVLLVVAVTMTRLTSSEKLTKATYDNAWVVGRDDETRYYFLVERRRILTNETSNQLVLFSKSIKDDTDSPMFIDTSGFISGKAFPRRVHLLEIRDGTKTTSQRAVEKSDFFGWLTTNPDEFTIESLLEFVDNK